LDKNAGILSDDEILAQPYTKPKYRIESSSQSKNKQLAKSKPIYDDLDDLDELEDFLK